VRRIAAALVAASALCGAGAQVADAAPPPIDHVFVIVLENKAFGDSFAVGQVAAPYMTQTLPSMGELVPRYYGIGHSSADNYLAMISGQPPTPASKDDCPDPLLQVKPDSVPPYGLAKSDGCLYPPNFLTLGDQLTNRGLTWRGYMDEIPGPCSPLKNNPKPGTHYARKHNPFVFFQSLIFSGQCAANDVGLDALSADLSDPARTPNLVYVTPNECNDGHTNCVNGHPPVPVIPGEAFTPYDTYFELQQEDAFLKQVVPKILAAPAYKQNGLLVITYDESDSDLSACCNEQPGPADPNPGGVAGIPVGPGGGQTGTVLLSPCIKPGSSTTGEYNHYSLLRSIEDLFGLTHLGYAGQQGLVPFGDDVYNAPRPGPGCAPRPAPSGGGTGGTGGGGGGQQGGGGGGGQGGGQTSGGCKTLRGPHSSFTTRGVRYDRRRIVLVGRSSERECDGRPVAIRVVQLAVARVVGGRCRFLSAMGKPGPRRACTRRFYLLARGGGRGFGLRIPGPLAPGGYVARIRAVDVEGRPEDRLAQGHVLHFTIR